MALDNLTASCSISNKVPCSSNFSCELGGVLEGRVAADRKAPCGANDAQRMRLRRVRAATTASEQGSKNSDGYCLAGKAPSLAAHAGGRKCYARRNSMRRRVTRGEAGNGSSPAIVVATPQPPSAAAATTYSFRYSPPAQSHELCAEPSQAIARPISHHQS
jgi:hypothetical protein